MPRERVELVRNTNTKEPEKLFLLAYEGNDTEPAYFEELRRQNRYNSEIIEIVSLRRDKDDTRSAPKYVFNCLNEIKTEYNLRTTDELWMIIDRDRNGKNIEKYYQRCQSERNFYLALSNPCFEFWLLLHLKDLSDFSLEEQICIHENKKVSNKRTYLKKLLSDILPDGYNESNIKPERFMPFIHTATERARAIGHKDEPYPSYLGTDVYKLIEKILKHKV